ncbi:MAG: tRNA uracil 4-sulfurtransferase ThiI [Eubacteriales bacterium]|jgi:thiamine biosynthesis protein ThiI
MKEIILAKGGEVVLKGANRHQFEMTLQRNIKRRMERLGSFKVSFAQSTTYVEPLDEWVDMDEAYEEMKKVFGVIAVSRAAVCEKDMEIIKRTAGEYLQNTLAGVHTFKVEARRSDKKFPLQSPQISREVGGYLLWRNPHLKVDVHQPDITVMVEIRDFGVYIHAGNEKAAGGLPLGTGGRATLLLSGGIDSPVAGHMIAKRGIDLNAVHFFSYPYTSDRAKDKVFQLAQKMCNYCDHITLFVAPFTDIQVAIRDHVREEYFTLVMRRCMMKIAQAIALQNGSQGLVTGESIGQVASQTMAAMYVTGHGLDLPVYRPLIGMDKEDIVQIARRIDTYDLSILPYEDCCTVFTPRHPKLKPDLEDVLQMEQRIPLAEMMETCLSQLEVVKFHR